MEPSIWQMLFKHDPNSADDSIPDLSKSSWKQSPFASFWPGEQWHSFGNKHASCPWFGQFQ